ncbi:MAG: WD40/YVTN/BNR-like repeat-containing protein [Thermodesulfobacteriota bacterium]
MTGNKRRSARRQGIVLLCCAVLVLPGILAAQPEFEPHDTLFSLSFPTEKDGWACGRFGTILHTSDGGLTWSRQKSGTTFTLAGICFTDVKNGWAVGNAGTILHTSDGGATWEKQESPVDYFHMDVTFFDSKKGFIVSERTNILATKDGGKSWAVQYSDEDYILKAVSFCDADHGWAVGEAGYIYRTSDGGETWEKQGGMYDMDEYGTIVADPTLFDVVAVDPQTAWAVGIQGVVMSTLDGGETWTRMDIGAGQANLYTIARFGTGGLVIAGKGLCVVSKDGGKTWQNEDFEPTIDYSWLYDIEEAGPGLMVGCGDEGSIYQKPSGSAWKRVAY